MAVVPALFLFIGRMNAEGASRESDNALDKRLPPVESNRPVHYHNKDNNKKRGERRLSSLYICHEEATEKHTEEFGRCRWWCAWNHSMGNGGVHRALA